MPDHHPIHVHASSVGGSWVVRIDEAGGPWFRRSQSRDDITGTAVALATLVYRQPLTSDDVTVVIATAGEYSGNLDSR